MTVPVLEPPPQPTTLMMISAAAKTIAVGYLRTKACCLITAKTNSEQATSKTRNLTMTARGGDGRGEVVAKIDDPEPVPRPPFEPPASKPKREKLRVAGGGG